jgi:uncharacterized protein (TIGR02996 family)
VQAAFLRRPSRLGGKAKQALARGSIPTYAEGALARSRSPFMPRPSHPSRPRPELVALLQAAKDAPEDDAPRAVLADWLLEHGGADDAARAEILRAQCPGARAAAGDTRGPARPERELLDRHRAVWRGPFDRLGPIECEVHRGMVRLAVNGIKATVKDLSRLAAAEAFSWVDRVEMRGATAKALADVGQASWPAGLSELAVISEQGDEAARAVAGSPAFARLADLSLRGGRMTGEGVKALSGASHLADLRSLDLRDAKIGPEGLRALSSSPHLGGLRHLNLYGCSIGPEGVRALTSGPGLSRLTSLELWSNDLGPSGAAILAESVHLGSLRELRLGWNSIGDAGVASLAGASGLPSLRDLTVSYANLTDASLEALAGSPLLARLTSLDLGTNQRITVDGVRALASSPGAASLQRLAVPCNYLGDPLLEVLAASPHLSGLTSLQLESNGVTSRGMRTLARAPWLGHVTELELQLNHIDDKGLQALAASPRMARCVRLSLWGSRNAVTDEGACALAASPHLSSLEELDLLLCPIGDRGARALIESPHLSRLRHLSLSQEHLRPETVAALRERFGVDEGD